MMDMLNMEPNGRYMVTKIHTYSLVYELNDTRNIGSISKDCLLLGMKRNGQD